MSEPGKAVFLSYASQDAEAAKRICDALRAAGVEVWFDTDGGLEHGDEWDQKIRRQIKECVLFLPLISANTQAREEGYFRIEWELAAERAMGIAAGTAFILPIVIDDTREPAALVPDRFRKVQWTKLPGGVLTPEVQARFLKLWSHRAGVVKHRAETREQKSEDRSQSIPAGSLSAPGWKIYAGLAGAVIALMAGVGWWLLRPAGPARPASVSQGLQPAETPAKAAVTRDWPKDPELRRVVALLDGLQVIPEDFRLAEEIATRALEKNPTDPETVTVMARVHSMWLLRGWDRSTARYQKAKSAAERALQLAPDEPEAHVALAIFLYARGAEPARALELAQRAVDLRPDEARFHRMRDNCLFVLNVPEVNVFLDLIPEEETPGLREALASAHRTIERFPRDPLARYELSRHYRDIGRWADFERVNEETLALAPVANALVWKARARFGLHGDLAGMKAVLDQVPARVRGIERTVFGYFLYAAFTGHVDAGLEALNGFTDSWMIDFDFRGPKDLLVASLLELKGKKELARARYGLALAELTQARARNPEDFQTYINEAWILHGLGRTEEARVLLRTFGEAMSRPHSISPLATWWFQAIPAHLLMGERATALTLIREAIASRKNGRDTIRRRLALDPRLAAFRDDPEITALLAEPAANGTAATPPPPLPLTPARELVTKARGLMLGLEATREDFALAEEYCQRALKLDPTDGEVWAVYAQLHSAFGYRGWDTSPERREQTRVMAARAIRLAPDSVQAKLAQAGAWSAFGINRAETEQLLRDVVAEQPDNQPALRFLAVTLVNQGKLDECLALNERSAALPGGDPLALFNNSRYLWQRSRQDEAYGILQRSLAQKPFASALIFKALMEIIWRGDPTEAEAALKQIPQSALLEDRANYTAGLVYFYQRRADEALAAWGAFPRDYYADFAYDGPKGLLLGLAHELGQRAAAAKIEWRTALALVEQRIAAAPNKPTPYYYQAWLLACLGEKALAAEALRTYEQLANIKYTPQTPMAIELAYIYARLGRFDDIFAFTPTFIRRMKIDPRFDAVRADPRYVKLLAEFERKNAEPKK